MSQASNYLENAILDYILGGLGGSPNAVYLALYTSDPGEANTGNEVPLLGSPTNGYARQEVRFSAASGGTTSNSNAAVFGPVTGEDWGAITHWALFDQEVGGNMLIYGSMDVSRDMTLGDTLTFAAGDVDITAA